MAERNASGGKGKPKKPGGKGGFTKPSGKGKPIKTDNSRARAALKNADAAVNRLDAATGGMASRMSTAASKRYLERKGVDADALQANIQASSGTSLGARIKERRAIQQLEQAARGANADVSKMNKIRQGQQQRARNRAEAARKAALTRKMRGGVKAR